MHESKESVVSELALESRLSVPVHINIFRSLRVKLRLTEWLESYKITRPTGYITYICTVWLSHGICALQLTAHIRTNRSNCIGIGLVIFQDKSRFCINLIWFVIWSKFDLLEQSQPEVNNSSQDYLESHYIDHMTTHMRNSIVQQYPLVQSMVRLI